MVNVCSSATGDCSGVLEQSNSSTYAQAVDLTGFTWATSDEVRSMFYDITGMPPGSLNSSASFFGTDFGARVFNSFPPTLSLGWNDILAGLTRDVTFDPERGLVSGLFVVEHLSTGSVADYFTVGNFPVGVADPSIGHFVYRSVNKVPEPGSLGLFGLGLLGLVVATRARRTK